MFQVINNETKHIRIFGTMEEAMSYQEYLVFVLGVDAEVL